MACDCSLFSPLVQNLQRVDQLVAGFMTIQSYLLYLFLRAYHTGVDWDGPDLKNIKKPQKEGYNVIFNYSTKAIGTWKNLTTAKTRKDTKHIYTYIYILRPATTAV